MRFSKTQWERRTPLLAVSRADVEAMIADVFPINPLNAFEILDCGKVNTNVRFTVVGLEEPFLLRLYKRGKTVWEQEIKLVERFAKDIPMPEFLYAGQIVLGAPSGQIEYPYAIQKWIKGVHMYECLDSASSAEVSQIARSVAEVLALMGNQSFSMGGYFKETLEIVPFESEEGEHPFVSYIRDCLKGHAGKWLGQSYTDKLWNFVLENQDYFPPLEPACLVQADFSADNILIDPETFLITAVLDWEFAFAGSYLFDIGTLLRFSMPEGFSQALIERYQQARGIALPAEWQRMIKIQDLSNLVGILNLSHECPNRVRDVKALIAEIMFSVPGTADA